LCVGCFCWFVFHHPEEKLRALELNWEKNQKDMEIDTDR
jgi:hypothetical protein